MLTASFKNLVDQMSMESAFNVEKTKPLTPVLSTKPLPKLQKASKLQHDKSKVELKKAEGSSDDNGSSWEDVDEKSDKSAANDDDEKSIQNFSDSYESEDSKSDYYDEETLPIPKLHPKLVQAKKVKKLHKTSQSSNLSISSYYDEKSPV